MHKNLDTYLLRVLFVLFFAGSAMVLATTVHGTVNAGGIRAVGRIGGLVSVGVVILRVVV